MFKDTIVCPYPFEEIEINVQGDVYTCCPSWNNGYSIGNIYKQSLDEIWNGEKVQILRKKILTNDFSLCNNKHCLYCSSRKFKTKFDSEYKVRMEEFPKSVKFGYDYECNSQCIICRKEITVLPNEERDLLDEKIDTFFIPLLTNAQILTINTAGDPFGSRHSRKVIQKATEKYPKLKFDFTTNGLLLNEKMIEQLNIKWNQIDTIRISIHAATAKTYGKIVHNGENLFPKLLSNLEFLSKMKNNYKFDFLFNFVVITENYKEIPLFIEFAKKYNAFPIFWEYKKDCCTNVGYCKNSDIVDETHEQHNELIKVLKEIKKYSDEEYLLYPLLKNIQEKT